MSKKKYMLVLTLVFCLTATLFIAVSTGYDPWLDHDEDGDVDTDDLYMLAGEYGSSGDPAKNVTVTNFPQTWNMNIIPRTLNVTLAMEITIPSGIWHVYTQDVTGYEQVTVAMRSYDGEPQFEIHWIIGGLQVGPQYTRFLHYVNDPWAYTTFPVECETVIVQVRSYSAGGSTYSIGLYATD